MAFSHRLNQANILVETLNKYIWLPLAPRITLVPFGYETHVPSNIRQQMRFLRTVTSKFVRFTPDFFVLDQANLEHMYLLDYKATQTPLYSSKRISLIQEKAGIKNLSWEDIGQMEADAYDNYVALQSINVRVVVLNYCAYHRRVLLCDYIQNISELYRDIVTTEAERGSRTPFVNFNCNEARTLFAFLKEEHGIEIDKKTYLALCNELRNALPVEHHVNSPLHSNKQ